MDAAAENPDRRYPAPEDGGPSDVADLIALLTLERTGEGRYRARNPVQTPRWRLYGGQVAAQAAMAAGLTAPPGRLLHSIHGYFLRGGKPHVTVEIAVETVRDGRSFSVRRVVARQEGDEIFTATCSFHVEEPGHDYQAAPMPDGVVDPEDMPEQPRVGHNTMFDVRDFAEGPTDGGWRPATRLWARTRGPLPDDTLLHAAAAVYLSDMGWAFAGIGPGGGPSIDHAVWLHHPARVDDWLLLDLTPLVTGRARGVYHGTIHDRSGRQVGSLAQEALLRPSE